MKPQAKQGIYGLYYELEVEGRKALLFTPERDEYKFLVVHVYFGDAFWSGEQSFTELSEAVAVFRETVRSWNEYESENCEKENENE